MRSSASRSDMPEDLSNRTSDRTESGERSATRMAHGSLPAQDVPRLETEEAEQQENEGDERRRVEFICRHEHIGDAQEDDDARDRGRGPDPGDAVIAPRFAVIAHGCDE